MRSSLRWAVIFSSWIFAWILTQIPLPNSIEAFRPEWLMMIFIFWGLIAPEKVTVTIAFIAGIFIDVLYGSLLGQYAITMALLIYFSQFFKNRYRLFPAWQQAFLILILVALGKLILLIIHWLLGYPSVSFWYWAPLISSMLIWPYMYKILRYYA